MCVILQEIESITDEFLYQIKRCEDYYGAWKELNATILKYGEKVAIAKDFFFVANEALLNSMMIELMKLYDQHPDSFSLKKFLNKCQSVKDFVFAFHNTPEKNSLYEETIGSFNSFLEDEVTQKSLRSLITRRDKYYMHNDGKRIQIQALVNENSFSFEEFEKLTAEAKKLCSVLYQLSTNKKWTPSLYQDIYLEPLFIFEII